MEERGGKAPSLPAGGVPDRLQPHADRVERSVLSAMLREPESCIDLAVEVLGTSPAVFYTPSHREIYATLLELNSDDKVKPDLVSVAQRLKEKNRLDAVGGELFLAELELAAPTTVNFESWCCILQKYAMLRRMIGVCSNALLKCYDADVDASRLIDEIENDVYGVRHADEKQTIVAVRDIIAAEFKALEDIQEGRVEVGIPTGFAKLDEFTGGLKPGEMFVLAARPSIGKTSLALNVIRNVALHATRPRCVAFFSLEMTSEQIARRLLCTQAQISENVFWNHSFNMRDLTKLTGAVSALQKAKIFIDPTGGLTIAELRAKARRLKVQHNIELIVIDYLQLMHSDGRAESRQNEVAEISGGIKKLAKDLKIPVLVLAQLNREVDKNAGNKPLRPKLAHLRESGTIEQDADIVTFLHRDREESKTVADGAGVEAEWIIEKNRNGRTGNLKLLFYPSRMEFVPAAPCSDQFAPGSGAAG